MVTQTLKIYIIAAMNEDGAIGIKDEKGFRMPFHLPYELQYFKTQTWTFPVIMGYSTFLSLGGRILEGRYNIILSRQRNIEKKHQLLQIARSLNEALTIAKTWNSNQVFIIGGATLYQQTLPMAHRLYLSKVRISCPEANIFFPKFSNKDWQQIQQHTHNPCAKNPYKISFEIWSSRKTLNLG